MAHFIYYDDKFITLKEFLLSESIKPKNIKYGINKTFDNHEFFKIPGSNGMIFTSFLYSNRIYTVTYSYSNNYVGFHYTYSNNIDNSFNYFDMVVQDEDYEKASPSIAAKVFGYVFYILIEMIKKYNLTDIRFYAETGKLDKFYGTLLNNNLFKDEFLSRGFNYKKVNDIHIFKS